VTICERRYGTLGSSKLETSSCLRFGLLSAVFMNIQTILLRCYAVSTSKYIPMFLENHNASIFNLSKTSGNFTYHQV
jgi:hypothetical protein